MKSICQESKLPTLFFIIEFDESDFLRILPESKVFKEDGSHDSDWQKQMSFSQQAYALIQDGIVLLYALQNIAQVTDQKIEYSKHKGLDDRKCEALLLDSLKDHGSLTKPEIVHLLWDVLPDQLDDKQKEYKINNILRKLRKEGKISNTTIAGNKSTWALVNG